MPQPPFVAPIMSSTSTTPAGTPVPSRSPSPPCSLDDMQTYRPLFRRRKPPVSQPPVPCLCCAIKGMHCVKYKGDVLCQRCKRNGNLVCILQRQDLTKPEEPLTREQLEKEQREVEAAAAAEASRHPWLAHLPPPAQLQCMVYTRDPELSGGGRRRLLELATEMLLDAQGPTAYVHGNPIGPQGAGAARNFVLPAWHSNDYQENKEDKEYVLRTHVHYFHGIEESDRAAAAQGSRRLGQERRRLREEKADQERAKREERMEEEEEQRKSSQEA